jgi:hypothetical protein
MMFRDTICAAYREFKRATFCARLLSHLSENGASYACDYAHQQLNNPQDSALRSFALDYPSFSQVRCQLLPRFQFHRVAKELGVSGCKIA